MFSEFRHSEQPRGPEKKEVRKQLDVAFAALRKERTEATWNAFFDQFREFAGTDLSFGSEYLKEVNKQKEIHAGRDYHFRLIKDEMLSVVAEYDPEVAMRVQRQEFETKGYPAKIEQLTDRWSHHVVSSENAEQILANIESHTPNPDLAAMYQDKKFRINLNDKIIAHAKRQKDLDRMIEIMSSGEYGDPYYNYHMTEFLHTSMVERMKAHEDEEDPQAIEKLVHDGLVARFVSPTEYSYQGMFDLDTCNQQQIDKLSDEALKKMVKKSTGLLKETLEEELLLRAVKKDPLAALDHQFEEIVRRNSVKTLLYGAISDASILEQLGPKPTIPQKYRSEKDQNAFFSATTSRHLDLAAKAAIALGDEESCKIYLLDVEGKYMGIGVESGKKSLFYAYQNFRRHPKEGAECLEQMLIGLRGRVYGELEYLLVSELVKQHPDTVAQFLHRYKPTRDSDDPWAKHFGKLPESFFEKGIAILDEDDPGTMLDRTQVLFKDKKQLRAFVSHLNDYPKDFVDSLFERYMQIEKDGRPNTHVDTSKTEDFTLLWNGVTKEDPQYDLMHKQLLRKYSEGECERVEKILLSPKLNVVRAHLNQHDITQITYQLLRESQRPENTAEAALDVLAEVAESFGKLKTACEQEGSKVGYFDKVSEFIRRANEIGLIELKRVNEALTDSRIEEARKVWGSEIAVVMLQALLDKEDQIAERFAFLKDSRLATFKKTVTDEQIRDFVVSHVNVFDAEECNKMLDQLVRPELEMVKWKLPWFYKMIKSITSLSDDESLKKMLDNVSEKDTSEQLIAKVAKYFEEAPYYWMHKEFESFDAASLAETMEKQNVSWRVISRLPAGKIGDFRDVLLRVMKKPEVEGGPALASEILSKLMGKLVLFPDRYATDASHILDLEDDLKHMKRKGFPDAGNYYANQSIEAHEELSNKHLKTKIQKIFFNSTRHYDEAFMKSIPKDAVVSLPLLDRWLTKESRDEKGDVKFDSSELQRFAQVFFTGQVFKKRTDLDRFNSFLLEARNPLGGWTDRRTAYDESVRELLQSATRLMEQTPDAKKRFFGITQKFRGLGFLSPEGMEANVSFISIELKSLASISDEEVAEYEVGWRMDLEEKMNALREEGAGVDRETDEGVKQFKKIEKKIAEVQKKLDGGYKSAQALEEKQKKILRAMDALQHNLDEQLVATFEQKSGIKLTQEEITRLFEKYKEPGNLFTYLGKLKESGDKRQQELFREYLLSVAKGTFPEVRYTQERRHLDVVFKDRPGDEVTWKENISFKTIHTAESEKGRTARKRMESFVREAVTHKHVEGTVAELMDKFLNETSEKRKEAALALEEHVEELRNDASAEVQYKDSLVALKLMRLFNKSSGEIKADPEVDVLLKEIGEAFKEDHPFSNDIAAIVEVVTSMREADAKKGEQEFVTVEETEDPDLMLRLGSDVAGSCQKIDGTPNLNRNLISYIMDGKIKVLVVRDSANDILGRALLRVLFDEETQKPVLQLERSYHRSGSSSQANGELLVKIAEERAQKMGYTLVGTSEYRNNKRPNFHHDLKSYRGPGSTEYVDSGQGARENGVYTILADSHVVIREAAEEVEKPSE